ncbi:MAG: 16S rRNA (uracil(1498)-N(3))-methyltransferase [Pirellulaceae bacterium]
MPDRYFLEYEPTSGVVTFDDNEANHLAKVMRAKVGDQVTAFDGKGLEYQVELTEVSKRSVRGQVVSAEAIDREPARRLTLGVALPKGERQRWLVEKCVELGVTRLVPLVTAHGVAQPVENALARLRKYVIEATKQCGRNRLMEIGQPQTCAVMTGEAPESGARWLLHPTADNQLSEVSLDWQDLTALIGPEGGFSEDEVNQARERHWQIVDLGPRILRVETAAVAIAARVSLG